MATINPTAPTYSSVEAAVVLATGSNGTLRTLDLKSKFGAWLLVRIGRRVATALTRAGYVSVRRSNNDGDVIPNTNYDCVSQILAAQSNTVASGGTSGTDTVTLTSATGFAVGDTICLHSDDTAASRVEWARVVSISSNTLTVERNFRTSHDAADRVTSLADVWSFWVPGGDIWEIRCLNNSGQSLVYEIDAILYETDTYTA